MKRTNMLIALASASLISLTPALAQGRGGGHGGGHGHGAGARGQAGIGLGRGGLGGSIDAGVDLRGRSNNGVETRNRARANSRGPERASPRALERANANSVLSGSTRVRADLSTLSPGLIVRDASGATIGTISRVIRTSDGTVRNVLVRAQDRRRTIPLAPNSLSVTGDVVTTTAIRAGRHD